MEKRCLRVRRLRSSTPGLPDSLITDIEKFISESGKNATMAPLYLNKRRLYDADADNNNNKHKKPKNGENETGKKRRMCKATTKRYQAPRFSGCSKFPAPKKRKATVRVQVGHKHKAKVTSVKICLDRGLQKHPVVKREIVDLTGDYETLYFRMKFARTEIWRTEFHRTFDLICGRATETIHGCDLAKASVLVPEIRCCFDSCVDLTSGEETIALASEKQLANSILGIVFSCHKIHNMHQAMADALLEIRDCVPLQELTQGQNLILELMTKYATNVGCQLFTKLSGICVRNFTISSFLKILCSRLEAQYHVVLEPKMVSFYLSGMLDKLRPFCTGSFAQNFLEQLIKYEQLQQIKTEAYAIFTPQQLDELKWQIQQYHLIVMTQKSPVENSVHLKREMQEIGFPNLS